MNLASASLVFCDCANEGHFAERGVRFNVPNGFSLEALFLPRGNFFSDFCLKESHFSLRVNSFDFTDFIFENFFSH